MAALRVNSQTAVASAVSNLDAMTTAGTPIDGLLARAGGIRGLVYTALPVTTFAVVSPAAGLIPAIVAALSAAAAVLAWQVLRRESTRPAVLGFAGVGVCAAFAYVTGQAKDFYLPGIWMYLVMAIVFTTSVLIRRPLVGVVWARVTGRDDTWRRVPRVRLALRRRHDHDGGGVLDPLPGAVLPVRHRPGGAAGGRPDRDGVAGVRGDVVADLPRHPQGRARPAARCRRLTGRCQRVWAMPERASWRSDAGPVSAVFEENPRDHCLHRLRCT